MNSAAATRCSTCACSHAGASRPVLAILAADVATLGMLFVLPQYVQYVQDGSAFASGLEVAPFGLGLAFSRR